MSRPRLLGAALAAALVAFPGAAGATSIDLRTLPLSTGFAFRPADGPSADPVLNATGLVAAFDTAATNIAPGDGNGPVRDVVRVDTASGQRRIASLAPGGAPADGPSADPAIDAGGGDVAFTSLATNLVPGDVNGAADVFVFDVNAGVTMVSTRPDGRPGNRPSGNADISADGRFVVFESAASDLVLDDTNGVQDIFVQDLQTRFTQRVSLSADGKQVSQPSSNPAISADGRVVSFESGANDLVDGDTNRVADVFVRDLRRDTTERVSVPTRKGQQDKAVSKPFRTVSDLDRTGRRVVFESEATNLTPDDTNRRSDIFLRDRRRRTTTLVSANSVNVQGNNDSVAPSLSPSGRYLAFQSFATNLAPRDATGADVFARDLTLLATTSATLTEKGDKRGPEPQLLQRPSISDDGGRLAFASAAPNLAPGDANGAADVFTRLLTPPGTSLAARGRTTVTAKADDPLAGRFLCDLDGQPPFACGPKVSLTQPGRRLTIRATGLGMLPDPRGVTLAVRSRSRPGVRITGVPAVRAQRTIRGVVTGGTATRVLVSVTYVTVARKCFFLSGTRYRPTGNCETRRTISVPVVNGRFALVLPRRLPQAYVVATAQSVDASGRRSKLVVRGFPVR